MTLPTAVTPPARSRALPAIFWAGLICGALDITSAFILFSATPIRILQRIASGLIGQRAFQGGWATAALGLGLHFFIAFSAASVFYAASRKISFMTQRPLLAGLLYGIAVYVLMYWIVKPLSLVTPLPFSLSATVIAIHVHMVLIGLPISLIVHHYSR